MSRNRAPEVRHPARRALGRGLFWLARAAFLVAGAVALAPVTVVAAGSLAWGWWRGAPPGRIYRAACWCLPMAGAWLVAVVAWPLTSVAGGTLAARGRAGPRLAAAGGYPAGVGPGPWWFRAVAAPYRAWDGMWRFLEHGHVVAAAVAAAPPAIPLGLAAGGACWAYRRFRMRSGAGGLTPEAPGTFDARQWQHQARAARALIAAPGSLPLLTRGGHVVAGATIRAVGHRTGRAAVIPYERLRAHQVVIGATGTGKTTLLLRLWAGFMAAGLRRYAAGPVREMGHGGRCSSCLTARAARLRGRSRTAPGGCCGTPARGRPRSGRTRRRSPCGRCRPTAS